LGGPAADAGTSGNPDAAGASGLSGTPDAPTGTASRASGSAKSGSAVAGARAAAPTVTGPRSTGPVRGVGGTDISIGYGTEKDADQFAAGVGVSAVFGDQEAQARAVVDYINEHGGVLGKQLRLVFHDDKSASDAANPDVTAAAQCTDWTQDRPVFAAVNVVAPRNRPSFFGCMARARTPLLVSDLTQHTLQEIKTYAPYLYLPGVAVTERWVPTWISRLQATGYFAGWNTSTGTAGASPVKIGLPYEDSARGQIYLATVKRELARVGLRVDDAFAHSSDAQTYLREMPSMLLRFRSSNVTHVLQAQAAYFVLPQAEQQHYRPRWALTTMDALSSLTITTAPAAQLHGTLGVGWDPVTDVDTAHDPGPVSANQTLCQNIMKNAGQQASSRLAATVQLVNCDTFFLLADALRRAGSITPEALQRGVASLTEFPSALTFVERYGADRYDGADAARDIAYDDPCSCFTYTSVVNRLFSR
jgi:ABC-type branched-subunit amino acid transport system substrate-binding protein